MERPHGACQPTVEQCPSCYSTTSGRPSLSRVRRYFRRAAGLTCATKTKSSAVIIVVVAASLVASSLHALEGVTFIRLPLRHQSVSLQPAAAEPRLPAVSLRPRHGRSWSVNDRGALTLRRWSFFGWGEEEGEEESILDEGLKTRFMSYVDGDGQDATLNKEGLRALLECTENFCITKHWLPDEFVEEIYENYSGEDGIGQKEFARLARDGLLLQGRLQEYEEAFNAIDTSGDGIITRDELGKLFAGLGRVLSPEELDKLVDDADIGHDGIDLADFLSLARSHLSLGEVLKYVASQTKPDAGLPVDLASPTFEVDAELTRITMVHGEPELNGIIENQQDAIVELAFTWCKPCKAFQPKYEKYAKLYKNTRFLKIVGNENESCKHYARDVLHAKISPMFAVYSKGKLVSTWTGANTERFMRSIEAALPSAADLSEEREAATAADEEIAPKPA